MASVTHSLEQHTIDCIHACTECARLCNTCADDMVGMPHEGTDDLMVRCIRLCRDCADICLLSAQWMGRKSAFALRICALCAEICELCAGLCEQHAPHHALCGDCAKECRRCAALCHQMVAETVPPASTGNA
ncbi:MAG: putative cysteine-rich protein YhjQ [Nitrospirae bacterium]|nr:putative cysteine-rich protein YhjQ [Nitrospirota bacterium]MCE7965348.1 four-helix bundle copper-binding protein [Nitrospira sp. NTP2]MCK6493433.1 four-helix bundle copper-binding protein [Nitrospira sp.]MEB2338921.1 four-helix bundle copper-binding protein [Nitrospirales bacterium]MCK6498587.1 four-helix bundle copper-binding protein [Nitrospira sp.]